MRSARCPYGRSTVLFLLINHALDDRKTRSGHLYSIVRHHQIQENSARHSADHDSRVIALHTFTRPSSALSIFACLVTPPRIIDTFLPVSGLRLLRCTDTSSVFRCALPPFRRFGTFRYQYPHVCVHTAHVDLRILCG
jgi:hypothetical protein